MLVKLKSAIVPVVCLSLVALAGCHGGSSPFAPAPGTISGVTYDAGTGQPTDEPIVIAMAQNEVRPDASTTRAAQQSAGEYMITVPPGTYVVECYVTHQGERYVGDRIEGVEVRSNQGTSGQDLTAPSVITADSYSSDGDLIQGWHWLRDAGYQNTSSWSFSGINRNRNITAHFMMLVTNQVNGGAGYDTTVDVTYTGNLGPSSVNLYLPPSGNPPDNQYPPNPEGYSTRAIQEVNQNYVSLTGDLDIDVARISPNPEHVATAQQSIWLVNY